ncbi:M23 family metallopeptidase [Oculatella sp. FACHB-28]|nr:M23 family metallopeptidase [Oculatella sp. FACHB-28]
MTRGFGSFLDRVWVIESITHNYQEGKFTTSGTCYSPMKNRFPPPPESTASTPTASNPGGFIRPAEGRLTSGFRTARRPNHQGVDIANATGTPIVAAASGIVTFIDFDVGGYGNWIEVDHQNGFRTRYGHLSSSSVTVGQQVQQGQTIARMGSTGRSTGPHLHFEIRLNGQPQDPENYI